MVEIAYHALNQDVLLGVLLTEVRVHRVRTGGRANNVEELIHHGQHTVKVSGAGCALELGAQLTARNANQRVTVGVHLLHRGRENNVHTGGACQLGISLKGARVRLIVLTGAELQRVHENGGNNNVILLGSAT